MSVLVVIPTYNEAANIATMIRAVLAQPGNFHLLVIDDNSPDGTEEVVESCMADYKGRLFMQKRNSKSGLGTAYIKGFKWAMENGYDYVIEMDADFSHDPADLPRLLAACEMGADVAIGSRYVKGGKVVNWPAGRVILSKGASAYVRLFTWMPVRDPTAGFVCYKKEVLQKINLDKIRFIGYAFQIEMKFAAWKCGFKIKEIPIVFKDRELGISKMTKGIFKEAAVGVINMQLKSFGGSYVKK